MLCVLAVFVLRVFRMFVDGMPGIAEGGSVLGTFVCGIGFEFGAIRGATLFDFLGFLLGEFGFRGGLVFGGVEMRLFLAFFFFGLFVLGKFRFAGDVNSLRFVLFKFGTAGQSIGLGVIGRFLVLRFG